MRPLITGASGFVGRALLAHLTEHGHDVVSLSRSAGGPDITDRGGVHAAIAASEPDVIFHLAAQANVPISWADPIGTLRTNVEGTQNVLDAANSVGDVRVLVVSSAEIYGSVAPSELPIDENAAIRPANPYAASKAAADAVAVAATLGRGQDVIRLRAFNHFGPGQSQAYVCSGLAHRIATAERNRTSLVEVGALEVRRDFSDVRDVVAAYRQVALHGATGAAYNVCSGVDRSIREIADGFAALTDQPIEFVVSNELQRAIDTPIVRGDNSRLTTDTGWRPQIEFATSIRDVLDDARRKVADED